MFDPALTASGATTARNKTKDGRSRLTCVDIFAGAGGLSLAARAAGLFVVAAIEKNKNACQTYRANLCGRSGTKLYEADVLELDPARLVSTHFSDIECDVLLGGPPCQGFSVHRIKGAGVGDPRNQLVLRYFEFVSALQPKVFLMENVPGILWDRHSSFLDAIYLEGAAAGYTLMPPVVLDARDFGVPQRRKRVFVLGIRNGLKHRIDWPPKPSHAAKGGAGLKPWLSASSVFELELPPNDPNSVHMNHSAAMVAVFRSTPPNGGSRSDSNRVLPCHSGHDGHTDVYGRIDPHEPGPTMTTACINPSKGRFLHPTEDHGITVRHAARFQTFPDAFVFSGGLMSAGEQIGNAVPVKLGKVLLKGIARGLRKTD